MRIINTQKKLCNRVFTNQANLPLFYDAFKNNFQQFNKFLKIKTHFLAKDGPFPTPGESIRRVFEIWVFWGGGGGVVLLVFSICNKYFYCAGK